MKKFVQNSLDNYKVNSSLTERNPKFCEEFNEERINEKFDYYSLMLDYIRESERRFYLNPQFSLEEIKNEKWKVIDEFPNYEISNLGRIYSRYSNKILKNCVSPSRRNNKSTPKVNLCSEKYSNGKSVLVDKLVIRYFSNMDLEYINSNDICIVHKNGNYLDCRANNLICVKRDILSNLYKDENDLLDSSKFDLQYYIQKLIEKYRNKEINDVLIIGNIHKTYFIVDNVKVLAKYFPIGYKKFVKLIKNKVRLNNNKYKIEL